MGRDSHFTSANAAESMLGPESALLPLFMRYLPVFVKLVTHLPAFLVGFVLVWVFFVVFAGKDALKTEYAPVSGFHIMALMLLRELFEPWRKGSARAAVVKRRLAYQKSFARDMQMQWHETLD